MKKSSRRQQVGATLLESLAFLGIASIIVVGAISMFRAAQSSAQANDMVSQINGMRSATKTLCASSAPGCFSVLIFPSHGTATAGSIGKLLIAAGSIPDTLRVVGLTINTSYGGRVYVGSGQSSWWITYTQVPQEVCLKVAPQIGGSWMGLQINSNAFVDTDIATFPVATADAQCTPGTSNTMHFMFR